MITIEVKRNDGWNGMRRGWEAKARSIIHKHIILIESEAKKNLTIDGTVDTGFLRSSNVPNYTADGLTAWITPGEKKKGVLGIAGVNYAAPIEFGSRPHMPPIEPLVQWVHRKGLAARFSTTRYSIKRKSGVRMTTSKKDKQNELRMAWAIAMKIKKKGTRPRPFLTPAFLKVKPMFLRAVNEMINKYTIK